MKFTINGLRFTIYLWLAVLFAPVAKGDLTVTVTPGYQFSTSERPTVGTLNLLGIPTVEVSGTLGGTNIAIAAGSITGTMLSGTVVDGVTVDFNASSPRAIEVKDAGIGKTQISSAALGGGLTGGSGAIVRANTDGTTIHTNASGQLEVIASGVVTYTNFPPLTNGLYAAGTNGVVTNVTFSSELSITNGVLHLTSFTTTNINITAQNSFTIAVPHGLGVTPKTVRWVLVCVTPELNYAAGDEVDLLSAFDTAALGHHFTQGANATSVFLAVRSNQSIGLFDFTTQNATTITLADWKLKCYARP